MTSMNPIVWDEHCFLRMRAMQLLDEGLEREARRLFSAIDREQARRIAAELQTLEHPETHKGKEKC